ncbi:MAG TPA: PAS domain S-box protein, partial [Oculatellaceae cyanobacterium]
MILAEFFIPHGHCYLWKPELVGLHIVSDALTAVAYYSIPLTLTYFVAKRRDVPFNWIFLMFGAFIVSCGTGHVMDIWTLWHPNYWLSGFVKAFTALVSIYTAFELVSLLPQALAMPSAAQFEAVKNEIKERQRAEAALQQQLAAVEAARDGIAIVNSAQEYIYLNQAHVKLYGYDSSTALVGKTWRELYYPDEIKRLEQDIFPILSRQGYWHGETIGKRQDGSTYCQEVSLTSTADGGLICVCRDISDRKLAEAEIIRTKDLLASLFNESADALFLVNTETLSISDCNQRAVELFEANSKDELLNIEGHTLQKKSFTPEELSCIVDQLELKGFWSLELEYVTKKGKLFWGNLAAKPINVAGQNINLVRVTDITDRKRAEEALRESLERERAFARAIQRMRQTLDIETIFTATTSELRQLIKCDRVAVYRFNPDWSGEFVSESVGADWISLVQEQANNPNLKENSLEDKHCTVKRFDSKAGCDRILGASSLVQDTYLQETSGGAYNQGASYRVVSDIYKAGFNSCYINLLERFQARAYIIVPIFLGSKLWGLLATYQNSGSRQWKAAEIKLVVEIGNQLGVALQQAELLAQIQKQSEALRQSSQREREKAQELEVTLSELRRTQTQLI